MTFLRCGQSEAIYSSYTVYLQTNSRLRNVLLPLGIHIMIFQDCLFDVMSLRNWMPSTERTSGVNKDNITIEWEWTSVTAAQPHGDQLGLRMHERASPPAPPVRRTPPFGYVCGGGAAG